MDEKTVSGEDKKQAATARLTVLAKAKRHAKRARAEHASGQLGLGFELRFDAARRIAREQNLRVQGNYLVWLASGKAPAEMPPNPDLAYRNEWLGWADFLRVPKVIKARGKSGRPSKEGTAQKPPQRRSPRKYVRKADWVSPRTDPRLDTRPLVEVTRYDLVDGQWHCGKQFERVLGAWGRNLCRVLARRVLPHEQVFFAVSSSASCEGSVLQYALRRGDAPHQWFGIEYEAGCEVERTIHTVFSHSPDEADGDGAVDEVTGTEGNPSKKRGRRSHAGGTIGMLTGARQYRKNPDNPRWKQKA